MKAMCARCKVKGKTLQLRLYITAMEIYKSRIAIKEPLFLLLL